METDSNTTARDPFDPNSFTAYPSAVADKQTGCAIISSGAASDKSGASEVKLLVFDMGHVFVDFNWEAVCQGFCAKANRSRDEFRQVLSYIGSLGYEVGKISTADFLAELNQQLQTSITLAEFTTLWNHTFVENPEMANLLTTLRTQRPLYLLSNTNENHYGFLQSTYDVARHFDGLVLSYVVGYAKPDRKIYEEVLTKSGFAASECLFIDDLEPNVAAAEALGMRAIRFVGIDDLKQRLAALGFTVL